MRINTIYAGYLKRSSFVSSLFSFVLFGIILILPFQDFPKGSDTPAYYLHLRMFKEEGVMYLLNEGWDRPLTTVFLGILDLLLSTFNLSPPHFLLCTQLVLGLMYVSSVFFVILGATRNKWIASLSSVLAATSANTLRFQPLISNFLGLCFATFSLGFLVRYQTRSDRNTLIPVLFFLVLTYFSYPWQVYFTAALMAFSSFVNMLIERPKGTINKDLTCLMAIGISLIFFTFAWHILWNSTFFHLLRRIGQVESTLSSLSFNFPAGWIYFETWTLKITGTIGLVFVRRFVKRREVAIILFLWFIVPILADLLSVFGESSWRFFLLIPFAVPSSFLIYSIYDFAGKIGLKFRIFACVITFKKLIPLLFVLGILAGNYYEAFHWQSQHMGPYLTKQDYEMLSDARKYIQSNCVILIYPVMDKGVWAESLLASVSRKVFVYYGKIDSFMRNEEPIFPSQLFFVGLPRENITIVLLKGFYPITPSIEEAFSKMDEDIFYFSIHNNSDLSAISNL